jgi:hypothetical protein
VVSITLKNNVGFNVCHPLCVEKCWNEVLVTCDVGTEILNVVELE